MGYEEESLTILLGFEIWRREEWQIIKKIQKLEIEVGFVQDGKGKRMIGIMNWKVKLLYVIILERFYLKLLFVFLY